MDQNTQKKKKKSPVWIYLLIIIFLFDFIPTTVYRYMKSTIEKISTHFSTEIKPGTRYDDDLQLLELTATDLTDTEEWKNGSLLKEEPNLATASSYLQDDQKVWRLYRFDVKVKNRGNKESDYDGLLILSSGTGEPELIPIDTVRDISKGILETRIIPPGREGIFSLYGVADLTSGSCQAVVSDYSLEKDEFYELKVDLERPVGQGDNNV